MFAKILSAAFIASTLTSAACAAQRKLTEAQYSLVLDGSSGTVQRFATKLGLSARVAKRSPSLPTVLLTAASATRKAKSFSGAA